MQLAGVQLDISWEARDANLSRVRSLLESARLPAGSLVALPEMFSSGFSMKVEAASEGERGEVSSFLADLARQREIYLLGGVVTTTPDGRGRNEAALFDPHGAAVIRYQKMHPFRFAGETNHYAPGQDFPTFVWNGFTTAAFVCYDLRFPELFRHAVLRGVELFCVIANWPAPREEHWITLLRARAIENQAYVMGVNRVGIDPNTHYSGRSLIVGPRGEVLVDAGSDERVFHLDLDRESLVAYRKEFPALLDLRSELLGGAR